MSKNNVATAVAFYTAMGEKNIAAMGKYLHPEVRFIGPSRADNRQGSLPRGRAQFLQFFQKADDPGAIWL